MKQLLNILLLAYGVLLIPCEAQSSSDEEINAEGRELDRQKFARLNKELETIQGQIETVDIKRLGMFIGWVSQLATRNEVPQEAQQLISETKKLAMSYPNLPQLLAEDHERRREGPEYFSHIDRPSLLTKRLPFIQTPESVKVLGEYLNDLRDYVGETNDTLVSNAAYAGEGLNRIGLRDKPKFPEFVFCYECAVPKWKQWYEEIKKGERSFSFEGQSVEYRFGKSGEIIESPYKSETSLRPERDLARAPSKPVIKELNASSATESNSGYALYWVVGAGAVLIFSSIFFIRRGRV